MTHSVCCNLNRIIDINFYPVETAKRSNLRHRPIGIGVQVCVVCALLPAVSSAPEAASCKAPAIYDMHSSVLYLCLPGLPPDVSSTGLSPPALPGPVRVV